ncbi:MAG: polysaccharide pyruvyl transferase family protein [Bacteroidota bacterium]
MKRGVVFYYKSRNIGDDIQSLAAYELLKNEWVEFIDRERLKEYTSSEKVKLLTNGWFLHHPENWPPSKSIHPYFISFHLAKYHSVRKKVLSPKLISYYKEYEPIGCRDYETKRLFESIGIQSFYSGCLTLTLPKREVKKTNRIVITDLFVNNILQGNYAKKVTYKLIPKKYHNQVKLVSHIRSNANLSIENKLKEANELLDLYASSKLVITSRIHCALPCLALGTSVIFFDFGYVRKSNRDRFEGVLDLINTVRPSIPFHENRRIDKIFKLIQLHRCFFMFIKPLQIDWDNPPANPQKYISIAEKLVKKVKTAFQ